MRLTVRQKWQNGLSDLEQLYKLECNKTVKLSKLTEVAVYPKPVERYKVSTCLQIFNEKTITALMTHPELKGAADTEKKLFHLF